MDLPARSPSYAHREFVREVLPRIAFANPKLNIDVSYFEKVKSGRARQDTNNSVSSSSSSPATSAAEEASKSAEAEAEAAGVTPVQEGDAAQGKQSPTSEETSGKKGKGGEESTLTIDFGEYIVCTLRMC